MQRSFKRFEEATAVSKKQSELGYVSEPKVIGMIKFGMGLFHFGASLIPPAFQWIAKIIGFSGDRDLAMEELEFAMNSGCPKDVEASLLIVGLKKFFFEKEDEAIALLDRIKVQYSESAIMWYLYGFIARNKGDIDTALNCFEKCREFGKDIEHLLLTAHYHLGYTYFLKNEWKKSIENISIFLQKAIPKRFKPYSCYQLGFCYWMTEEKDKIAPWYRRVDEWTRSNQSYDEFAKKKTSKFLETNEFSKYDEVFISAMALFEGKLYKRALKKIEELIPILKVEKNNRDYYLLYYYLKGAIMRGLKKDDRAKEMLEKAIAQEGNCTIDALYAIPYSYCELAELEIDNNTNNNYDQAEAYLKKSENI